jgi:lipoprotein-releasing system permease protein
MFAFTLARRYLVSSRLQTALLVSGVAPGVTIFVFITALIQALALLRQGRTSSPHRARGLSVDA